MCLQVICLLLLININKASGLQSGTLYKKNAVPVTSQRQAVKIFYTEDFPYSADYEKIHFSDCLKVFRFSHKDGKIGQPVLRCQASIRLLRLAPVINRWEALQKRNGYFFLNIKELSIIHVRARITERTSDYRNSGIKLSGASSAMVTGIFSRYVLNVREYIFQNVETGIRSTVIATPAHRFYVKNKKAFIPIGRVSFQDNLLNSSNQILRLLCPKLYSGLCEKSVNFNLPVKVYNMEIDKKHTYFVGAEHIMVHNVCKLTAVDVYDYFNNREQLSEVFIDEDIRELQHRLKTLKIYIQEDDIENLHYMNTSLLGEGEADTFSHKEMFKQMGFCELMPFAPSNPDDADLFGFDGNVSIWYLKYPFFQVVYEDNVIPHIAKRQSIDMFMQKKSGRIGLCYADFYKMIKNIYPYASDFYIETEVDDLMSSLPIIIQKRDNNKLAL